MILHRITLRNVGVYGGEHTVELTPPDAEHPVILIGALNGGGKTTLLGALQLALYGSRVQGMDRTRKGYKNYLRELIHRRASLDEGASVALEFERQIDGQRVIYKIRRSWRVEDGEVHESLTVNRNGEPDALLASHWDESIDAYLPARIAHLFFFDGEQIEQMADEEAASDLLASAFQSLLGLDLVGRLQDDLATLERKKKVSSRSPAERTRIELLEKEAQQAAANVDKARQDLASLVPSLERKQNEQKKLREKFRADGGELVAQREVFEEERRRVAETLHETESKIRVIAAGAAPLLLIQDQLEEVRRIAESETHNRRQAIIADAEEARDSDILQQLTGQLSTRSLKIVRDALLTSRPQRKVSASRIVLNAEDDLADQIGILISDQLPELRKELHELSAKWVALDLEIDEYDRKLSTVPDVDALGRLQNLIAKGDSDIVAMESKRNQLDELVRRAEFELRICEGALSKEVENNADAWNEGEHDRRILQRIPKLQDTLDNFRSKVITRHVGSLETSILEAFQFLARKDKLIGSLSIHPNTFRLTLTDADGQHLPFNLLSAGERQLLATSILWGLAKVSGRPVPLVIDTPLGRLDSHHRTHVVERYFPTASHQVVLLSTDEEIVGRYHQMISPYVGRRLLIEVDQKKEITISESYFQN